MEHKLLSKEVMLMLKKFKSTDTPYKRTGRQFQFQNTAMSLFSQFTRTYKGDLLYNPFTDFFNQLQNNSYATNQSSRSNDITFLLKTITTTIFTLPEPSLDPLEIIDTSH